jgi:hypothetical protein
MDLLFVILAHTDRASLEELVENVRVFCPRARMVLYNSGSDPDLCRKLGEPEFPAAHEFGYAKITPFFFEVFEWAIASGDPFDALVNLETDMLFIRSGYEGFVENQLTEADYLAPNLVERRSLKTRWRPMRSLRPEFEDWFQFFGFCYWHGSFSPAQVFSRRYVESLVQHRGYAELRKLVQQNRSFTLQEVVFPTLTDFLGLRLGGYPKAHSTSNRYRPYQAVSGVRRALTLQDAYFVHPVRRKKDDAAREFIRGLTDTERSRTDGMSAA